MIKTKSLMSLQYFPSSIRQVGVIVLAALRDLDHEARSLRETVTRLSAET